MVTRADIMARGIEANNKPALTTQLSKLAFASDSGQLGRIRDKERNTAWRRLLGFPRDKAECPDSEVKAYLEAHFELCVAVAMNNAFGEAVAKNARVTVEDSERVLLYLGTRTAALKAFSPEDSANDSEI